MQTLTISTIAKQAGAGIDTIRYYERSGLLPEPPRRASGYREYPLDTVAQLRFIRRGPKKLIAACPGHGPMDRCPIVAASSQEDAS